MSTSTEAIVLVARPTPSGIDERSLADLAAAVAEQTATVVRVAHLDQADPSIAAVLDDLAVTGRTRVRIVPLAVPADRYLRAWIARAVAHWRHDRSTRPEVELSGELSALAASAVSALATTPGRPVTASPEAFRSPAWSDIQEPDRHLFVCRGPRCTVYGAGGTHRVLTESLRGSAAQVTPTGCLGPCNLGPLVIEHPGGTWHQRVDGDQAAVIGKRAPTQLTVRT